MALNTILSHPDQDSYVTVAEADSYLSIKTQHTIWSSLNTTAKEGYLRQAAIQIDSFRYKSIKLYDKAKDYRQGQGLAFPRYFFEDLFQGKVVSATATTFVIHDYLTSENTPDDVFNGGSVIIQEGTGKGQTVAITDWVYSTGTGTVASWTTRPDSTSQVLLVLPIDKKVKYAQMEQAFFLAELQNSNIEEILLGISSYKIGDLAETYDYRAMASNLLVNGVPFSQSAQGFLKGLIDRTGYIAY
jgi:hypothetical protein